MPSPTTPYHDYRQQILKERDDSLRRIVREELDRKPAAWRAAAEAAIAAVRYGTQVPFAQWNAKRQEELDREAQRLVQELDNARPE